MAESAATPSLQKHEKQLKTLEGRMDQMQEFMAKNFEQSSERMRTMGTQNFQINQKLQTTKDELAQRILEAFEVFQRPEKGRTATTEVPIPATPPVITTLSVDPTSPLSPSPNSLPQLQLGIATNVYSTSDGQISYTTPYNHQHHSNHVNPTPMPNMVSQIHTPANTPYAHLSTMFEPWVEPYSLDYPALQTPRSHPYDTGWYPYSDSFSAINHTVTLPPPNSFPTQALLGLHNLISQTFHHIDFASPSLMDNSTIGEFCTNKKEIPIANEVFDKSPKHSGYIAYLDPKPPYVYNFLADVIKYGFHTPSYDYSQTPFNPYNPYIPGDMIGVDAPYIGSQQYYSVPSYKNTVSSPGYYPMVVQSRLDIPVNSTIEPFMDTSASITNRVYSPGLKHNWSSTYAAFTLNPSRIASNQTNSFTRGSDGSKGKGTQAIDNASYGKVWSNHCNQLKVAPPSSNGLSSFGSTDHGRTIMGKVRMKINVGRASNDVNGSPDVLAEQNRGPRTNKSKNQLVVKAYTSRVGDNDAQRLAIGHFSGCPIFLFSSVNASGQFCGVAEMIGVVDFHKDMEFLAAMRHLMTMIKVAFLLVIEPGVFPLMCGWWLDVSTIKMFGKSISQRVDFFSVSPLASSLIHWVVGIVYMLQISIFVILLRGILRNGILYFLRDPADLNYNPFRDLIDNPVHKHASRVLLSVAVYGSLIVMLVNLPIKYAMRVALSIFPLDTSVTDPYTEIPADMLLFQICIPYAIKHFKLRTTIKSLLRYWFTAVGWALGLTEFLLPTPKDNGGQENGNEEPVRQDRQQAQLGEQDRALGLVVHDDLNCNRHATTNANLAEEYDGDEQSDPDRYNFVLRIVLLLVVAGKTLLVFNSALIVIPISLGRALFKSLPLIPITHGIKCNDLYASVIGSYVIWTAVAGARYFIEYIKTRRAAVLLNRIWKWCGIVMKNSALLSIWIFVIPVLIGLLFELLVILLMRVPGNNNYSSSYDSQVALNEPYIDGSGASTYSDHLGTGFSTTSVDSYADEKEKQSTSHQGSGTYVQQHSGRGHTGGIKTIDQGIFTR